MRDKRPLIFRIIVIVVILGTVGAFAAVRYSERNAAPDHRDALAECLTAKNAKMYGAYWCPHCQAQKKSFGNAFKKVTYVECAIPGDSQNQTQACKDANIKGYPTWVFASGDQVSGEQSLETLAGKAGCDWKP